MVMLGYLHDPLVHLAAALALALLFGTASLHKWRDLSGFSLVLQRYGLALAGALPPSLLSLLVYLIPSLELLAAIGVLASPWYACSAMPALALLVVYAGALLLSLRSPVAVDDCGCHFGQRRQPPSLALVVRNLLLALLALNLLMPMSLRSLGWLDLFTLSAVLLNGALIYLVANLLISNRVSLRDLR